MTATPCRTICWSPIWNRDREGIGLEHLVLADRIADGVVLAIDDDGTAFRLAYHLAWDESWRLREADLAVFAAGSRRTLGLRADGEGCWRQADGRHLPGLDGCIDIDIWPTPFTNSFPIWRSALAIGQRREFRMAWISAPALTVAARPQAYTRLAERRYLFESLDGDGFRAELPVDEAGVVLDYPGLFRRVEV
ncbi:putative glycolipid-binding domain-containing protein [Chitinimonas koreensis]|uniref:putative glycolipid-binding domain-containing protein n=1 Tax=Chitinimonas koreensis TaxID=356302 RepID=UPI000A071F37|nr:putative glycolipid-binding domain-containing protein [Chitinimonas koreensis]QNM97757.1 putative glycolipid-binding domain-containing protein [Chitinimonas koreensis]